MVDHIIMQAAPVLLGTGIPLFTQKEELKRYRLESVKKYGQFAELVYEKGIRCVWKMNMPSVLYRRGNQIKLEYTAVGKAN